MKKVSGTPYTPKWSAIAEPGSAISADRTMVGSRDRPNENRAVNRPTTATTAAIRIHRVRRRRPSRPAGSKPEGWRGVGWSGLSLIRSVDEVVPVGAQAGRPRWDAPAREV